MNFQDLKSFLDEKAEQYNRPDFIDNDPIQVPHRFSLKQDVEISGLLTAIISWGNRKSIINNADKMMSWLGESPHDFILNFKEKDLSFIENKAVHRTFNSEDFVCFITNLQRIYRENESLEQLFLLKENEQNFYHSIERFRNEFFRNSPEHRSRKHISSTYKKSAAKRIMMFLRWMVRKDKKGVDFGIWQNINQAYLSIPLDVHTGNMARRLEIISRTQNDWKTVEELDLVLRKMDAEDPAKYDFALFGLGVTKELD
ncbi:MAG: TIGR02757 family protein [Cruoricaptor ignavus]|nr:TIGR02757 family protein [Cruoricaptor ignavus]